MTFAKPAAGVPAAKRAIYVDADDAGSSLPAYFAGFFDSIPTSVLTAVELVPAAATRVLDVGCAVGKTGRLLKSRREVEVVGIELIEEAAAVADRCLDRVLRLDLDAQDPLPYPQPYFDVALLLDVLEHLVTPSAVIGHLLPWIKPGGSIILSVPNVTHMSVLAPLLGPEVRFQDTSAVTGSAHLQFFTLNDLLDMLQAHGLWPEGAVIGVGTPPDPAENSIGTLAAALGGDATVTTFETRVVQWLIRAGRSTDMGPEAISAPLDLQWRANEQVSPQDLGLDWA